MFPAARDTNFQTEHLAS